MHLFRRAAARTVLSQPSRQLSTLRSSSAPLSPFQSTKPAVYRSFHQSRIWRADEEAKKPIPVPPAELETTGEPVAEAIAEEGVAQELTNEAIEAAEVAGTAAEAAVLAEQAVDAAESVNEAAAATAVAEEAAALAQGASEVADVAAVGANQTPRQMAQGGDVAAAAGQSAALAAGTAAAAATTAAHTSGRTLPPRSPPFASSNAPAGSASDAAPSSRIIYVGNLFFEVTTNQLEAEFEKFGQILNSRIATDPRGLSKGFAYIEFATQESAERAIRELDQKVFQGRRMAVQVHAPRQRTGPVGFRPNRPINPPSKTLFIGNLSYQMSDKDLNDLFREIRDVLDVRVAIDRRTGQPRGFAHADFVDQAAAERAKAVLENKTIYGRNLRVDFSAASGSSRQAE